MAGVQIRDMQAEDEYYVATCSHVNESAETDASGHRRLEWIRSMQPKGMVVKVAVGDGKPCGFLLAMPGDVCPVIMLAEHEVLVVPCLWVPPGQQKKGIGSALLAAAEDYARANGFKAIATQGRYNKFWFMPGAFFEKRGYTFVERAGALAILWKTFDAAPPSPRLMKPRYEFQPALGKVVVDLFWLPSCLTTDVEAQRVREVAAEFGDRVVLNEYRGDDRQTLLRYQNPRAIYVNGRKIDWGYAAPREGIREAIQKAIAEL